MSIFSKSDTTSKLTAEVDRLTKKRAALAGRLVGAQSAETAAIEARRRHLVESDDEDISTGAKFSAAVDAANRDRIAIEDALSELDKLIEEGRQAVIAAKESAERARRAAEIEAKAKKLEPMIAAAERHFEALADVLTKIVDVADDRDLILKEYSCIRGPGGPLPAINLVSAALAEALFKSLPDGFAVTMSPTRTFAAASLPLMIRRDNGLSPDLPLDTDAGQGFRPLPLSGSLSANLVDPLRMAASEILNGARPLSSVKPMIADDDGEDGEPAFGWRRLVFVRPARWQDWQGETVTTPDSDQTVPAPVALEALRVGAAVEHGTKEAERQIQLRENAGLRHEAHILHKNGLIDLQVRWPATTKAAA